MHGKEDGQQLRTPGVEKALFAMRAKGVRV
jgi:hypothetical protein